jgi:hypothetical protein
MEEKAQTTPAKKGALQILLPLFPAESTMINNLVGVQKKDTTVYYFNGFMPIFNHDQRNKYRIAAKTPSWIA